MNFLMALKQILASLLNFNKRFDLKVNRVPGINLI